jgi:hypothetical protein
MAGCALYSSVPEQEQMADKQNRKPSSYRTPVELIGVTICFSKRNFVEWLSLLLRIQEVLRSNIGSDTSYADRGFRGFTQKLQANARVAT